MEDSFSWTPALDVKVEFLNEEHRVLITRMNHIARQNKISLSKDTLITLFEELIQFTRQHFDDEEKYLSSIQYPKLDQHARIHNQLIEKLNQYRDEFRKAVQGRFPESVFDFFRTWITTHILIVDKEYANFITEKSQTTKVSYVE